MSGTEYWARQVRAACEAVDIEVEILERPAADEVHVRPALSTRTARARVARALEANDIAVTYGPDAQTLAVDATAAPLEHPVASGGGEPA